MTERSDAPRLPAEFRYFEQRDSRRARRLRRALGLAFGPEAVLPDEVVRTWGASYYDADPVAEAFMEEVSHLGPSATPSGSPRGQREGRRMLDQALVGGVASVPDAPASLRRLFAEMEEPPAWLDPEQVALGARVFRRWGTDLFSFAGVITLEGYRENSVAKPLAMTGAYTGASANRRFLETAAFWVDVAQPGALDPGGAGRATALRVRLMHVSVRKRLLAHPAWDLAAWGVPISQGDALLTLMGGSFIPGYGLRLLGYRTSRDEILATLHFWRWVGHLMGVQPRWYPTSIAEAAGLMYASMVKGVARSGDDGRGLARSYLASWEPGPDDDLRTALVKRLEWGFQRGYLGWFMPPHTRAAYGLPAPGLYRLLALTPAPLTYAAETLRRRSPAVERWVDERARRRAATWVKERLGPRRAEYQAVESFTR